MANSLPSRYWLIGLCLAFCLPRLAVAADWPTWRYDAARTAVSPEQLPEQLYLQWVRELPPLKPAFWQIRQDRLQFDLGYEPVVAGKTLFVGSSRNDSVAAFDTATGVEKWRVYVDGPVRLAPAAWNGKLFVASDDGWLRCLDAASGKLLWKVQGAPSSRKILGNDRFVSVWPARGGPVVENGRVYFAAGIWPFEGIFVHALDANTGKTIWINDRTGSRYAEHPHSAMSFGGPSPQGYLLVHRGRLAMPSSRAFPAFLDLATGNLADFEFGHGGHGSRPGGWFFASNSDGQLCVDPNINTEMHDAGQQVIGQTGVSRRDGEKLQPSITIGKESFAIMLGVAETIRVGGREFRFRDGYPGVEGRIHTMLAADGKLFAVTREGRLYCFGGKTVEPKRYAYAPQPLTRPSDAATAEAAELLRATGQREGYALVIDAGRLAEELALQSSLRVVVVERDAAKVDGFRRRLDAAGIYGDQIAVVPSEPADCGLPPYFASLIARDDSKAFDEKEAAVLFPMLRPYGGAMRVEAGIAAPASSRLKTEGKMALLVREALPGAANYTGQPNFDDLVRAPLGLLWFGDTFHHHKLFYQGVTPESGRGLPGYVTVEDGVMSYMITEPYGSKPGWLSYADMLKKFNEQMHAAAFSDVYTGRPLAKGAKAAAGASPVQPLPLARRNPITGREEAREYMKTYGCDLVGADYGNVITLRSGTAAFYDKRSDSGTINVSGTRSGCRNSMVPACGVLSVPAWTGNCTCNYPVFTSLAMVTMPDSFEQWTAWGGLAESGPIQRVGINFGAPGDRMARDGTLWLDWPSVGGPSPDVVVRVEPETAVPFYRHALWMQGGESQPWVFASGIQGVRFVRIETTARAANPPSAQFSARWTGFLQTDASELNTFHVRTDGTARLWVDGFPMVDTGRLKSTATPREGSGKLSLEPGRKYPLLVEYSHSAAAEGALMELSWSSPSRARSPIPTGCLTAPNGRPGVAGVYYHRATTGGPGLVQVDPQVRFEWGRELPAILKPRAAAEPAKRNYTVRLVFAEPDALRTGDRVFSVKLQGVEVLKDFDIVKAAGGANRGVVREFKGISAKDAVEIDFIPSTKQPPLICGVELAAE